MFRIKYAFFVINLEDGVTRSAGLVQLSQTFKSFSTSLSQKTIAIHGQPSIRRFDS
jgi:hypothetical protein